MKRTIKLIYVMAIVGVILCCTRNSSKVFPIVNTYFPKSTIKSFTLSQVNSELGQSLTINGKVEGYIKWKKLNLYDGLSIKIPSGYDSKNGKEDLMYIFNNSGSCEIFVQLIVNSTKNTLDFFNEVYQHSVEENFDFNLFSAKYFKTTDTNFITYELLLKMNEKDGKNILGLIYTKDNNKYFDITMICKTKLKESDRFIFTEVINSLQIDSLNLLPYFGDIISEDIINVK